MAEKKFLVKNGIKVFADAVIDSDITVAGTASITKGLTADTLTGQYLGFDSDMQNTTTNRLPEGTSNLYYTSTRVDSDIDGRVDSAYLAVLLPEYVTKTGAQTLTNKTLTDPILAGANFYNQTYSGFSVNYDLDFGDSTQTVYTFASDSTTTDAVLAVGIKGQTPTGFIAASQSEADLILGLPGTSTQFKIRNNTGHTPFGLDDGDGTDLVVMATDGKVNITNSTEATTKTSAAFTVAGGIGADKNIRAQDIIAANNIQAASGQLLGTLSAASLGTRTTTDLPEGTNRYYTDARVDSYINQSIFTSDVSEGSNLYYTTARADSDAKNAISVSDGGGDGSLTYNPATGVISYVGPSPTEVRAHLSAGTGMAFSGGEFSIGQPVGTSDSVQFNAMSVNQDVVIYGDLTVAGTQTVQAQTDLSVSNAFIKVADSNSADTVDIGIVGRYSDDGGTTIRRTGFIRDADNGEWYVFDGLVQDGIDSGTPTDQTININGPGFNLPTWNFGNLRGSYLGFDSDFAAFSSNYVVYDSDFTAANAGRYAINTNSGPLTVTLPANPETGDYVRLIDVANFSTNSVIVNRNGETIEGFSDNFELDLGQSIIEFIYINSNWQVYTSIGQRGPQGPKGDSADVGVFASQAQSIAFAVALG